MFGEFKSKDTFRLFDGSIIKIVEWWAGWESCVGESLLIDGDEWIVVATDRNRCNGFGQYSSDLAWEQRDVYLKVRKA